jgi:hypothetical protein
MYAGWDAANVAVTGGVNQGGTIYKNAQFPVAAGDRLCMVAWVRAYPEGGAEAGPYVGINYTGSHGVVDAGHNHGTHYVIGSMATDPANTSGWSLTPRNSYGAMTQVQKDGVWHRYASSFAVDTKDVSDQRRFSPELTGITWTADNIVYGQPRLMLFGKAPERADSQSLSYLPAIDNGADFGDVYVWKAEAGDASACPSDADLDALEFASDKVTCAGETVCVSKTAPLPATDRQPAYPGNVAFYCSGCTDSFGAAPGGTTCGATKPFCTGKGRKGGTCAPCGGDAASSLDATTRCAADAPTCAAAGSCGKCATSADCVNADPSVRVHVGPTCDDASGACFACTSDHGQGDPTTACRVGAPLCDAASGLCGKCDGDADVSSGVFGCKGQTPTCRTDGVCAKCASDADCVNPAGVRLHARSSCNLGTGVCEGAPAPVPPPGSAPTPNHAELGSGANGEASGEGSGGDSGCSTTGSADVPSSVGVVGGALFALSALLRRRSRGASSAR